MTKRKSRHQRSGRLIWFLKQDKLDLARLDGYTVYTIGPAILVTLVLLFWNEIMTLVELSALICSSNVSIEKTKPRLVPGLARFCSFLKLYNNFISINYLWKCYWWLLNKINPLVRLNNFIFTLRPCSGHPRVWYYCPKLILWWHWTTSFLSSFVQNCTKGILE